MATHKSAEKAHRQSVKRNLRNNATRSAIRTAVKEVRTAVAKGDAKAAQAALVTAQSKLAKGAKKKVIKKNNAARVTSRLNASVKKIAAKKK
jgi:small subunit ribosomal protein S20